MAWIGSRPVGANIFVGVLVPYSPYDAGAVLHAAIQLNSAGSRRPLTQESEASAIKENNLISVTGVVIGQA